MSVRLVIDGNAVYEIDEDYGKEERKCRKERSESEENHLCSRERNKMLDKKDRS